MQKKIEPQSFSIPYPKKPIIYTYSIALYNLIILCIIFFHFSFIGVAISTAEEFAGKLVFSKGSVLFSLDKGESWSPVTPLMEFPEGAYIKVESNGEAALMLNDRSQIRLSEGSVLFLKKTGSAPGEEVNKQGILEIFSGKLWFRNKRKGSKPVFATPVVSASIRGTEMAISVADDGTSDITVLEGRVQCYNAQGEAIIARGEGVTAQRGKSPIITKLLKPEKRVQWLLLTPDIIGPADAALVNHTDLTKNSINENSNRYLKSSKIERDAIKIAQKAMELLVQGESVALETAHNAVKLAPNRASTHVALATVLQSTGKFKEALQEAEKATSLDPISVPALIREVELLLGLDNISKAEKKIFSFRPQAVSDVRVDMLKGYIYLIKLDSQNAERLFKQVVVKKSNLASAYLGLGLALYHQKRNAEGLENMEKACLLEPLAAYPHIYLAKAQYELGERYEAEVELKRAVILDPYDPTPHMYLATIFADNYRHGEGIKSLEKAIALNDNKLMSRSRYLLDQDRASKNISLAWSLTTMGLYEWADSKGDQAVWDDEANSSAYLFRASRAQILGQFDADTIGDMKRAELLKPVNANTYTSYNDYQNLLETPQIKGSITLNAGNDDTGNSSLNLTGGNTRTAFNASGHYTTTDGPVADTGKSSSEGNVTVKQVIASGHEIVADARVIEGDMEDMLPWRDLNLKPSDVNRDYDLFSGSFGYHWHQGAGRDMMVLLQTQKREENLITLSEKYISSIDTSEFKQRNWSDDSDKVHSEIVQLFRFGDHKFSTGIGYSTNDYSWNLESRLFYEPPAINENRDLINGNNPKKEENRFFSRDIWSISDNLKLDMGVGWCQLDNIVLDYDEKVISEDKWLPHLGFMWQVSSLDIIRGGYFREIEPDYINATLYPSEMAGFSKIFGSEQGTLIDFYGLAWDRQWSSQIFTRTELLHKERFFPNVFTSHATTSKTQVDLRWKEDSQEIGRVSLEYLITDRFAMALAYQFTDHNTESGDDRNRVDNDLSAIFTWVHPSGVRIQNTWWYMNQDEKSGYKNPVDEDFIIASISAEKSLLDKKLLLVAKWENIFNKKYTYLISDTTEVSQLPWQGSLATIGLRWNF